MNKLTANTQDFATKYCEDCSAEYYKITIDPKGKRILAPYGPHICPKCGRLLPRGEND